MHLKAFLDAWTVLLLGLESVSLLLKTLQSRMFMSLLGFTFVCVF